MDSFYMNVLVPILFTNILYNRKSYALNNDISMG